MHWMAACEDLICNWFWTILKWMESWCQWLIANAVTSLQCYQTNLCIKEKWCYCPLEIKWNCETLQKDFTQLNTVFSKKIHGQEQKIYLENDKFSRHFTIFKFLTVSSKILIASLSVTTHCSSNWHYALKYVKNSILSLHTYLWSVCLVFFIIWVFSTLTLLILQTTSDPTKLTVSELWCCVLFVCQLFSNGKLASICTHACAHIHILTHFFILYLPSLTL